MQHHRRSLLRAVTTAVALVIAATPALAPAAPAAAAPPEAAPASSAAPGAAPPEAPPPGLPPLAEALTGSAKGDYDAAGLLYEDGDFAAALVKYRSAYEASKDARLLWNAATCEKNLRHYAKAVALVTRYLRAGAPYVAPDMQQVAQTFLDAVKPLTANVTVVSNEAGATVSVDGEIVGTTPVTEQLLVDIGARQFSIQKDGFKGYASTVNVTGSGALRVDARLERIVHEGRLIVRAKPGHIIVLDGHGVGSGTWEAVVPSGGHTLRVTAPDMQSYQSEVMIQDGQTRRVDVTLEPTVKPGVPAWVWIVGSAAIVAGAATGGYFLFKPSDSAGTPTTGTMQPGTVQLPLRL